MPSKKKGWLTSWEPEWLAGIHFPAWMVLVLALVFLARIPSFFEPFYYGDEMIYIALGQAMKKGMVFYRDIFDHKPPVIYILAGLAGNVFWFRAILAAWMMATTVAFWKLSDFLFAKNKLVVKASVVCFAVLTTIPLLEGQIANAEVFMIGPTIYAFYLLLSKKLTTKLLVSAGLLFSLSALFKVPSVFDIGTIIFMWLIALKLNSKEVGNLIKNKIILFAAFAAPILLTGVYYWTQGALNQYIADALLLNLGYLSSWRPDDQQMPFLVRNAPVLMRAGIVVVGLGILYWWRKKLTKPFIFATAWVLFSLFAATLSERPYPHYLIQVVPGISLLVGLLFAGRTIEQSLTVIPLLLVVGAAIRFQYWHYPTLSYYQNFFEFFKGDKNKSEYFDYFSADAVRNYKLAEFIVSSSTTNDQIFVWGDSSPVYALSDRLPPTRYVTTFHIRDFSTPEETMEAISKARPKFIIILPDAPSFAELNAYLAQEYIKMEDIEGADIWKSIDPAITRLLR